MSPAVLKLTLAGVLALLLLTAGGVWKVQENGATASDSPTSPPRIRQT